MAVNNSILSVPESRWNAAANASTSRTVSLTITFPFSVKESPRQSVLSVPVERKMAVLSFALPYDIDIAIPNGSLKAKEPAENSVVYVFEMDGIAAALDWLDAPACSVQPRSSDWTRLEQEVDDFMAAYEAREKRAKKRLHVDADGRQMAEQPLLNAQKRTEFASVSKQPGSLPVHFEDLEIKASLKENLAACGFKALKAVQATAIPLLLARKDVIVQSQTGSGKTLAFLVPLLNGLDPQLRETQALVVAPTRELCQQIFAVCTALLTVKACKDERTEDLQETAAGVALAGGSLPGESVATSPAPCAAPTVLEKPDLLSGISCECFIGGSPIEEDWPRLGASLVVATPGRLRELVIAQPRRFQRIRFLILDEADKLLSYGFEAKLLEVIQKLPRTRVSGLFSATLSDAIGRLSRHVLQNPVKRAVQAEAPDGLAMQYIVLTPPEKLGALLHLVRGKRTIVFFATCAQVDFFSELVLKYFRDLLDSENNNGKIQDLNNSGGSALGENARNGEDFGLLKMHGKMPQAERSQIYARFAASGRLLFCTDIAARGIDFKGVDLVVHFDIPKDYANIVHRSGRTARCGAIGESVLFLMPNERVYVKFLALKEIAMDELTLKDLIKDKPSVAKEAGGENDTLSCPELFQSTLKLTEEEVPAATLACVTYLRSYREHTLSYLLDHKELDLEGIRKLFFLERLPPMKDSKKVGPSKRWKSN